MISIHTNLSSIIAQNSLSTSTNKLNHAIERMTTGYKVNHAKDNAAGYSIITDMTTKLGAYQVAQDNCAQGLDLTTTASESLTLIEDRLQRLRSLAIQANNDTYVTEAKYAINAEANALVDEIGRVYCNTKYDDRNLLGNAEKSKFIKDIIRRDTSEMATLESVDINTALTSGTYSISTPQELAKLATMTNNGLVGQNTEFVLANDIDLSCYDNWTPIGISDGEAYSSTLAFKATFDGNGYKIKNLTINKNKEVQALFGIVNGNAKLKNIALENFNVNTQNKNFSAGLVGYFYNSSIDNCYTTGKALGYMYVGGLIGYCSGFASSYSITNCYSECNYTVNHRYKSSGGLLIGGGNFEYINKFENNTGFGEGNIVGSTEAKTLEYPNFISTESIIQNSMISNNLITFQIGIGGDSRSQIDIDTGFSMIDFSKLKGIGLGSLDYLTMIDEFIDTVSQKQTELGAVQNRLESALDSIGVNIHNLTSSRSTLRDADIAKESARFVQEQILQEASATLLATANQSPAIALQLI